MTGEFNRRSHRRGPKGGKGYLAAIRLSEWRLMILGGVLAGLVYAAYFDGGATRAEAARANAAGAAIRCHNPHIIDGDTLRCDGRRIRLASIDAPELPGHCRPGRRCATGDPIAAQDYLRSISRGRVQCRPVKVDAYGRIVAFCEAGGRDLSCAMVAAGHAIERYGRLIC